MQLHMNNLFVAFKLQQQMSYQVIVLLTFITFNEHVLLIYSDIAGKHQPLSVVHIQMNGIYE